MKYYSTNKNAPVVNFREATIAGQAPDKGLYFPEMIPHLDAGLLRDIESHSNEEIAFRVIRPFVGETIPDESLYEIVSQTVNFPIPLVPLNENIFSLELFHGPTLAFKDVGARFMSRCLGHFVKDAGKKVTVLVATSGDTGGAVADGFYNVEGVEVVILYPSGKVSPVQEKQLTTHGNNIHALEVSGTFDDCQAMVKAAFADDDIRSRLFLTSANSINVARWLPQQFYYFFAYKQWPDKAKPPVMAVPSGNFGNICAGMLAMESGLPIKHFIAACNVNDIASHYLATGLLQPKQAIPTLSNAMDVGNPSNFVRVLELFGHNHDAIMKKLSAATISDEETSSTISRLYNEMNYLADPHGAVGFLALENYLHSRPGCKGIFLETAHPVKFPAAVGEATGKEVHWPETVNAVMQKEKNSIAMEPDTRFLKEYLLYHH
ncbi:MAG: threonine synthase [Chitinophagaceae bacterium]|nr:threonine synthase [Chitinophagaceae bacterium]